MSIVEQTLTGQRKLISFTSSIAFRSSQTHFVDKIASRLIKKKKDMSSVTNAKLMMLLELRLITSFRPHGSAETFVAQREQFRPLRAAFLRQQIGL